MGKYHNFIFNSFQKHQIKSIHDTNEWKNLIVLKNNVTLIIKEADKGSTVIVMDLENYKSLILFMVENYIIYEKIEHYNPQKTLKNLSSLLRIHGNGLTEKEIDYLSKFKYRPHLFYKLPKYEKEIHILVVCKDFPSH